jgi:radical SAM protein with 4Fe4S-binding SPASM domain
MGHFPNLIKQLPILRKLNIRIYFPADKTENYSSIRILSSLGISTGIVLQTQPIQWENLLDLATYALLGFALHAPIEPFHYMAKNHSPNQRTDYNQVYFENPSEYLYLNNEGWVALTCRDLLNENYILKNIAGIDKIKTMKKYIRYMESWKKFFLFNEKCSYCPAWRICLGKFFEIAEETQDCQNFFVELLEMVESCKSNEKKSPEIWQP